jgi:two-component system, NarL family, invasion response regulator UvrY
MIRVVIADDHELIRTAIVQLLSNIPGIKVVGEASDGEGAIRAVREKNPDVLLLDVSMSPGIGGIEAAKRILANNSEVKIIVLSAYMKEPLPNNLFKIGVKGYLTKGASLEETVKAIRDVVADRRYIDPKVAEQLALNNISDSNSAINLLSVREIDVFLKIINGEDVQAISEKLCVSPKTVNSYRYRIFEKLNVDSDVELVLFAVRHGLLDGNHQSFSTNNQ